MFTNDDVKAMGRVVNAMRRWASCTACAHEIWSEEYGAAYNAMMTITDGDGKDFDLFVTVCNGVWSVVAFYDDEVMDEWRYTEGDASLGAYMKVNLVARIMATGR